MFASSGPVAGLQAHFGGVGLVGSPPVGMGTVTLRDGLAPGPWSTLKTLLLLTAVKKFSFHIQKKTTKMLSENVFGDFP